MAVCVGIGLAASLAAAAYIEPLLFGISPTDPSTNLAVAAALLTVAIVAAFLPAWRSSQVDPREALQAD